MQYVIVHILDEINLIRVNYTENLFILLILYLYQSYHTKIIILARYIGEKML